MIDRVDHSQDLYEGVGVCSAKCKTCIYRSGASKNAKVTCDYILIEGHRRPCPAGTKCTVYKKFNSKRKPKKMGAMCL